MRPLGLRPLVLILLWVRLSFSIERILAMVLVPFIHTFLHATYGVVFAADLLTSEPLKVASENAPHWLVHINALLNGLATLLLILGYRAIKRGNEQQHKRMMLSAFITSVVFLGCYLAYHVWPIGAANTKFPGPEMIKYYVYYPILLPHVLLAMTVPFLVTWAIYTGNQAIATPRREASNQLKDGSPPALDYRKRHLRFVRWAFPIWMFVSITGVIVYVLLHQIWPALPK